MKQNTGLGIAVFVLSIIGFITGILYIGIVFDIIAIILGIITLIIAKKHNYKIGLSLTGIIISICSILLMSIIILAPYIYNRPISEDKLLESATKIEIEDIIITCQDNYVQAQNMYEGNIYIITGMVRKINDDGCDIVPIGHPFATIDISVKLAEKEDTMSIRENDIITVVGKINSVESYSIYMNSGYIIENQ